jgi:hypothetical protein
MACRQALNALDGCKAPGVTATEISSLYDAAKKAGKLVKLGGGFCYASP